MVLGCVFVIPVQARIPSCGLEDTAWHTGITFPRSSKTAAWCYARFERIIPLPGPSATLESRLQKPHGGRTHSQLMGEDEFTANEFQEVPIQGMLRRRKL